MLSDARTVEMDRVIWRRARLGRRRGDAPGFAISRSVSPMLLPGRTIIIRDMQANVRALRAPERRKGCAADRAE